jgi:hypothetical protein
VTTDERDASVPARFPGRRVTFTPDDGGDEIELSEYIAEPEPFVPGETLDVWPVRAANGVQGYIVARSTPYAEPMSESSPETLTPSADEPDARTWFLDDGTETLIGPVERALREDVSRLKTTAHFGTTLLASATALAQAMDRAQPDKIASIGREFREHLKRIEELSGDDNATVQHRSSLSTPV